MGEGGWRLLHFVDVLVPSIMVRQIPNVAVVVNDGLRDAIRRNECQKDHGLTAVCATGADAAFGFAKFDVGRAGAGFAGGDDDGVHIFGLVSVSLPSGNTGSSHIPPGAQVFFIGAVHFVPLPRKRAE
jgi:hypothetical protein